MTTASVLPDQVRTLAAAMGDEPQVFPILLTCSDAVAGERLGQRENGAGLSHQLKSSTEMASRLDRGAAPAHRLDTDDGSDAQNTADIIQIIGWDGGIA